MLKKVNTWILLHIVYWVLMLMVSGNKIIGHVQNPPSQIWEPHTDRGLGVLVIVKNKLK